MSKFAILYVNKLTDKVVKYELISEEMTQEYVENKIEQWNNNEKKDTEVILVINPHIVQALELKENEKSMKNYAKEIVKDVEKCIEAVVDEVQNLLYDLEDIKNFIEIEDEKEQGNE